MDLFIFFVFVCLPIAFYAYMVNQRRRDDRENFTQQLTSLSSRLSSMEDQVKRMAKATASASAAGVDEPKVTVKPAVVVQLPEVPPPPPPPPMPVQRPPIPAHQDVVPRPAPTQPAPTPVQPSAIPPGVIPPVSAGQRPPQAPGMTAPPAATSHAPSSASSPTAPPVTARPPSAPSSPAHAPTFQTFQPPKKKLSMEQTFGTNLAPKIGIVLVVVGLAYLLSLGWNSFPLWLQVVMLYTGAAGLLTLGIFLERKDAFKILGRVLVGGGWAAIFLLTYGIGHSPSVLILHSESADLFLLMAVAAAMVWHTLKYESQLVTGCAFLLGFVAVVLSVSSATPDPTHLFAGAILVAGMLVVVHRYKWYELEVFGILTSYLCHLYWLHRFLGWEPARAPFPFHNASVALVVGYWIVFRASYVWRKVSDRQQEAPSTAAALLNPVLFLAVMKYQSLHPEWAWWALLTMGAIEFTLGQLPSSRKREMPFKVLSTIGATLMVAALPFKWSGDSLEMLWLAAAEAFLLAGIFTRERLFRGFGIIITFVLALYATVVRLGPWSAKLLDRQPHYDAQLATVMGAIALVLYVNSHFIARRWRELFQEELEKFLLRALSFVASVFAVCAVFACIKDNVAATVLAVLVLALSWMGNRFEIPEFVFEAHWIAAVAFLQVVIVGEPNEASWLRIPQRIWMFGAVAGLLYLSSLFVKASKTAGAFVFAAIYAWCATLLLSLLIYFQAPAWAVIVLWVALGLALCAAAQVFDRDDLKWQAFVLVLVVCGRALFVNFELTTTITRWHLTYRFISVSLAAAGIYLLAKWAPLKVLRPVYTVIGTLLFALLAYDETPAPWVAVAWISLATLLALAARWWKDRALLWQTHILSLLAVGWTLWGSFTPHYRATGVQLWSVLATGTLLYLLTWITNVDGVIENERMSHVYSWAGSLLMSWLLWSQLKEVDVALAWGFFWSAHF